MTNDIARLSNELRVTLNTVVDDNEMVKLSYRFEELLSNYSVSRKSQASLEEDIPENIEMFLDAKKLEGFSPNTLEDYRIELRLFSTYCKKATVQVTTPDIRSYLSSDKTIMTSTVSKKLSVLKSFFGWLVQEEVILRNPTSKIKLPKTPKRLPKALTIEELELVRESCTTLRQKALCEVLYSTGTRVSELSNLNISDLDMQNMNATVIGKGDKEGKVYFSVRAMFHLKRYLESRDDDCEALFVTERHPKRRMSVRAIQDEVRKIKDNAQLDKALTPHVYRHTVATLLLNNNASLSDVQKILRHASPSTTLIYAHASEEKTQQAHRRHHVI